LNRIQLRIYTVAAFPPSKTPELVPSGPAKRSCREAVRRVIGILSPLTGHDLQRLGPGFAFVVWVAARSLVILWTSGAYESPQQSVPSDLDLLLSTLRHISAFWPCAGRYVDILQLAIDSRNLPGGTNILQIFNDTRRTSYGLLHRLGPHIGAPDPNMSDFLNMTFLEEGELSWTMSTDPMRGLAADWLF
jgi:hypothetical protein